MEIKIPTVPKEIPEELKERHDTICLTALSIYREKRDAEDIGISALILLSFMDPTKAKELFKSYVEQQFVNGVALGFILTLETALREIKDENL